MPDSLLSPAAIAPCDWLTLMFEQSALGIAYATLDGYIIQVNDAFCALLDTPRAELLGQTCSDLTHPDDRQSARERQVALIDGTPFALVDKRFLRAGGSAIWCQCAMTLLRDAAGAPQGFSVVLQDISARKQLDAAAEHAREQEELARRDAQQAMMLMREAQMRFHRLIDTSMIGIAVSEADIIVETNAAFLNMVGYSQSDLINQHLTWHGLAFPEYEEHDQRAYQELITHGECEPYEKELRRKDGSRVPVLIGAAQMAKDPFRSVTFIVDRTVMHQLEEARLQMQFVVAHELRTPLTTLKLASQLVQRRLTRAGLAEAEIVAGLTRDIVRMERLVNDLLTASRTDPGNVQLNLAIHDLGALCRKVADEQQTITGRPIVCALPPTPTLVLCDLHRLQQVIGNLLSNALKYSDTETPVILRLTRRKGLARVSVQDQGQGIPREMLPLVFDRAYRVPGVRVLHGSSEGLGIGLYVCKVLVEAHGARLQVASIVGEGTTFWFALPLVSLPEWP